MTETRPKDTAAKPRRAPNARPSAKIDAARARRRARAALKPIQGDSQTWFYVEKRGLLVVHEARTHYGSAYIQTDQYHIPWRTIERAQSLRAEVRKAATHDGGRTVGAGNTGKAQRKTNPQPPSRSKP